MSARIAERLTFILILLVAALLRLGAPGVVEFRQDEANLSRLALDLARGRDFPLLGIDSSVGIRNAPMSAYLLAPPYLLSDSPVLATSYVGLLNVIAVGLVTLLARRYYGVAPAIAAGALYAAGLWAVHFSRKLWAQEMLPLFVALAIGSALLGFLDGKRWAQLAHLPLLAIAGQIHYGAFFLIPISLFLLLVGWRRRTVRREFWLGLPLAALIFVPYLAGALRDNLFSPDALARAFTRDSAAAPLTISTDALRLAFQAIAGTGYAALAGDAAPAFRASAPDPDPLLVVLGALVGIAALWLAARAFIRRDRRTPVDVTVLLWLAVTPLAFSITWTPVYSHYMIAILPAAFLALGAALGDLLAALRGRARAAALALGAVGLAAVVALQAWVQIAFLDFANRYATPGGFSTPLGWLMPVRDAILDQSPEQALATLDGQFIGFNEQASIWNVLLDRAPLVRFLGDGIRAYPAQAAVTLSLDCSAGAAQFYMRPPFGGGANELCYAVGIQPPGAFDAGSVQPYTGGAAFANSARLVGYAWDAARGCLRTAWTADRPARGPVSDFFNLAVHVVDSDGARIAQADAPFWNGRYWRAGDVFARDNCLPGPPDGGSGATIAGARLGLYTIQGSPSGDIFHNVDVIGPDGAPAGQQVEIRFD